MEEVFDLLKTVEYGGCSAKLSAKKLQELLGEIPILKDANVLVDVDTHDDAGVYKISEDMALIVTTDFFPPICSDPFEFGQIAAANALSDVYAMGGKPLLSLNINMFPKTAPLEALRDILLGGQSKIQEAGAFTMGGHTIEDEVPKYGLALVGTVHPNKIISNASAKKGDVLILTKALGVGILISAHRMGIIEQAFYQAALDQMKHLNKKASEIMCKYPIQCATDVTGFGLLGHLNKMAIASHCQMELDMSKLPALPRVMDMIDQGCIPGGVFRNMEFIADTPNLQLLNASPNLRFLACDPQTSGGLMMCVPPSCLENLKADLAKAGEACYEIGRVL